MKYFIPILFSILFVSCNKRENKASFIPNRSFINSYTLYYSIGATSQIIYTKSKIKREDVIFKNLKDSLEINKKHLLDQPCKTPGEIIELSFDSLGKAKKIDYFSIKQEVEIVFGDYSVSTIEQIDSTVQIN